jgi:hypothetical protein
VKRGVHQAACDYGLIENDCQSKLHLFLVSILKAAGGYEKEFQACGERLLHPSNAPQLTEGYANKSPLKSIH